MKLILKDLHFHFQLHRYSDKNISFKAIKNTSNTTTTTTISPPRSTSVSTSTTQRNSKKTTNNNFYISNDIITGRCEDRISSIGGGLTCVQFLSRTKPKYCDSPYIQINCCSAYKYICL